MLLKLHTSADEEDKKKKAITCPRQVYSESGRVDGVVIHVVKLVQNVTNHRLGEQMKGRGNETVITRYFGC